MTGLEPHPIFKLPTREQMAALERAVGREEAARRLQLIAEERRKKMEAAAADPLNNGFRPEIWNLVDDLLVDGNKVVLDLTRLAKLSADGKTVPCEIDVPKEIEGAPEIWIGGSNRSSKSEYGVSKIMRILDATEDARTWSFADTGPISVARQQPVFWKYLPVMEKRRAEKTGKFTEGVGAKISYKQAQGFAGETFVLMNRAQHWFKNYAQDIENMEGDQLDGILLDELRNVMLLKTLRGRMGDRGGVIIVSFTSIDENYSEVVNEYDRGSRTIVEVPAELLPIKRPKKFQSGNQESRKGIPNKSGVADAVEVGVRALSPVGSAQQSVKTGTEAASKPPHPREQDPRGPGTQSAAAQPAILPAEEMEIVGYEKVPRIKVAGPGSDNDQRANIVYFHITDNPFYGFDPKPAKPGAPPRLFGKERFYRMYRHAIRTKILSRVYGILTQGNRQLFPEFNEGVHVIDPDKIPRAVQCTNYHVVDPHDGKPWAMLWPRLDSRERVYIAREWPSTGHNEPSAYIQGIGDPGPWTLPGGARPGNAKPPEDGTAGPAQNPMGFGLRHYMLEILRLEGHKIETPEDAARLNARPAAVRFVRGRVGGHRPPLQEEEEEKKTEEITERLMDSRYGASPTATKDGQTTIIESMAELGMEFRAASGKDISEGIDLIHEMLDYDKEVPIGEWSPRLARLNAPRMLISRNCPNTIYALQNYTGRDGMKGACKEWIDLLRYFLLADVRFLGEGAFVWRGGGSY